MQSLAAGHVTHFDVKCDNVLLTPGTPPHTHSHTHTQTQTQTHTQTHTNDPSALWVHSISYGAHHPTHTDVLVGESRGGKDYDAKWGERMTGDGPYAWMIGRRFEIEPAKQALEVVLSGHA